MVTKAIDQLPKKHLVRGIIIVIVLIFALFVIFLVLPKIFAEIRYPLAYEELIITEAAAHDLDPFLVAAVIHTESRFNPGATSPVGARGLMQIMPLTGQGIARRMGETGFSVDQLYDPATNISYGSFHLQGLMGRYDGQIEPAIVAYNGGGGAGDNYLAGQRSLVPLESLNYVDKVLTAKAAYEDLYKIELGGEDPLARTEAELTLIGQIIDIISAQVTSRLSP
ncbi:lytic transglycosylase domain-containing protein [Candidatus Berkelbacteria bacterium]|nr:lytic transglycosylase domain-containing protein [Candidatus Berkelbacteria bacterium]